MKEVLVYVITHKEFDSKLPNNYVKLMVGSWNKPTYEGYLQDCVGEHISEKNPYYCELTGLYWMWKNSETDIIGLCHYRRFFSKRYGNILSEKEILNILEKNDIILPTKGYGNTTVYDTYSKKHHIEDLEKCRKIIQENYPEYLESFQNVMEQTGMYPCNMFITKKDIMDEYCQWLFTILSKLEETINIEQYDNYQKRIYGFLAERLFNVWVQAKKLKIKEVDLWLSDRNRMQELKRKILIKKSKILKK